METSRRGFLKAGVATAGAAAFGRGSAVAQTPAAGGGAPLIHVTDLFHPHGDPDDHFDLAVAYALALRGRFDLRGVVVDYPPEFRAGDPAVAAVTQMNRLAGLSVPVSVGTARHLRSRRDALDGAPAQETAAARFIAAQLLAAERPAALVCVGNAADIAVAALREPALFKEKCAGVYLNSGAAHGNPGKPDMLEFNVKLDPAAYAAMFDLPCPLHWFPCWHTVERRESGADGSFYWLPHREALAEVSAGLANFFAYLFEKSANPKWLRAMATKPDAGAWEKILSGKRGMWSTASQFAAAGLAVTKDGGIVPAGAADAVFEQTPADVSCADDGRTAWTRTRGDPTPVRRMLRVTDPDRYPAAMTQAVATLFKDL
jgi:hypothetical protein